MGFTRYWTRVEKPLSKDFCTKVKEIIKNAEMEGIEIKGWDGNGKPCITTDLISFNGDNEEGLSYETFILSNNFNWDEFQIRHGWQGYAFCKTGQRPYDTVVEQVLKVAEDMGFVKDVSSDAD